MAERVELHLIESGVHRVRAWATGSPSNWRYRTISVGTLPDGTWWCSHSGHPGGAYLVGGEQAAHHLADEWMADGLEWRPTPASFDAKGQPSDGLTWHQSGGDWFASDAPTEKSK